MKIGVVTKERNVSKTAVGALAAGFSFLNYQVLVSNPAEQREHLLSFHYPTQNIHQRDETSVISDCDLILSDTLLENPDKPFAYIIETLTPNDFKNIAKSITENTLLVCTQESVYEEIQKLSHAKLFIPIGADDAISLVHPRVCFDKQNWIASLDMDKINCMPTNDCVVRIVYEAPELRYFYITHRPNERADDANLYVRATRYYNEAHNMAIYPIIAMCRVLVIEAPTYEHHAYFPYRTYFTAASLNCWVVAVKFQSLPDLPGIIKVENSDEMLKKVKELASDSAPLPFQTERELEEFRARHYTSNYAKQLLEVLGSA